MVTTAAEAARSGARFDRESVQAMTADPGPALEMLRQNLATIDPKPGEEERDRTLMTIVRVERFIRLVHEEADLAAEVQAPRDRRRARWQPPPGGVERRGKSGRPSWRPGGSR